ncbi:MAG: response regulator [Desulfobacterales bacterium]|nr:response regulator [Desulfobacterales bacterium]
MKIAVVEADKDIRSFLIDALSYSVNREVLSFESGLAIWNYLECNSIDIIFCDADIPDLNGFELISKIKNKYPKKICILMTGKPHYEKKIELLKVDAMLAKPFDLNDIFNLVQIFIVEDK